MGYAPAGRYVSKDYVIRGSLIELSDREKIWQALDKRVRTSIRKGERSGVLIKTMQLPSDDLEAMRSITPNDDDIPEVFEERHQAYIAIEQGTGERLGWILLAGITGTQKIFMLCHASTKAGKDRQTPNLLLWHAINKLIDSPYRYFDVGASYRASLQKYFEGFRQYTYPLVMRPLDVAFHLSTEPFTVASFGEERGDSHQGQKILQALFETNQYTTVPTLALARKVAIKEYGEKYGWTPDDELLCIIDEPNPFTIETIFAEGSISIPCRFEPSEKTRAIYWLPSPSSLADGKKWKMLATERAIPLIVDASRVAGSEGIERGELTLYSASALFPVPFGAFIVGLHVSHERLWKMHGASDPGKEEEVHRMLAAQEPSIKEIREVRLRLADRYRENLRSVVSLPPIPEGCCLDMLPITLHTEIQAKTVKECINRFGIEAYHKKGSRVLFVPCHQALTERHVDYISGAILANYREGCGVPGIRC